MITTGTLLLADVGWGGHMDLDSGWWIVMVIGMFLFWALVIAAIVWVAREIGGSRKSDHPSVPSAAEPGSEALKILDRRLADGEISTSEYRERRSALQDARESGHSTATSDTT